MVILVKISRIYLGFFLLIFFCFTTNLLFSQSIDIPKDVHGVLSWFVTMEDSEGKGVWVDVSENNSQLLYSHNNQDPELYRGALKSVNFNRGLYFDQSYNRYWFSLRRNPDNRYTIISVLAPEDKYDGGKVLWSYAQNAGSPNRILDIDHINGSGIGYDKGGFDYGESEGSDLDYNGSGTTQYEATMYGKIVTYYGHDLKSNCSAFLGNNGKQIDVFSDRNILGGDNGMGMLQQRGIVPEMIVLRGHPTEDVREKVETYLAIKYGISKEEKYTICSDMNTCQTIWDTNITPYDNHSFRITGICDFQEFNYSQSRSNSYYDEYESGRNNDYNIYNDWSKNRERLITLTASNELVNMEQWWKGGGYVWGDNNEELADTLYYNENESIVGLARHWRINQLEGQSTQEMLEWCNVHNINFDQGEIGKEETGEAGFMATTQCLEVKKGVMGGIQFRIAGGVETGYSWMGLSDDNMVFDNNTTGFENLRIGFRFSSQDFEIVFDSDGDGVVDYYETVGGYQIGDQFSIEVSNEIINTGEVQYTYDLLGPSVNSSYVDTNICLNGSKLYGKYFVEEGGFALDNLNGFGFIEVKEGAVNVEYSMDQINKTFYFDTMRNYQPVLLIDRQGQGAFLPSNTDYVVGSYSVTPDGKYDKIEFLDVSMCGDGNIDDFTLGFNRCSGYDSVVVTKDYCCGDSVNICIDIEGCELFESVTAFLQGQNGEVIHLTEVYLANNNGCVGKVVNGNYKLGLVLPNCDTELINIQVTEGGSGYDLFNHDEFYTGSPIELDACENLPAGFGSNVVWECPPFEDCTPHGTNDCKLMADMPGLYIAEVVDYCNGGQDSCIVRDSVWVLQECLLDSSIVSFTVSDHCCASGGLLNLGVETNCIPYYTVEIYSIEGAFRSLIYQESFLNADVFPGYYLENGQYEIIVWGPNGNQVVTQITVNNQALNFDLLPNDVVYVPTGGGIYCVDPNFSAMFPMAQYEWEVISGGPLEGDTDTECVEVTHSGVYQVTATVTCDGFEDSPTCLFVDTVKVIVSSEPSCPELEVLTGYLCDDPLLWDEADSNSSAKVNSTYSSGDECVIYLCFRVEARAENLCNVVDSVRYRLEGPESFDPETGYIPITTNTTPNNGRICFYVPPGDYEVYIESEECPCFPFDAPLSTVSIDPFLEGIDIVPDEICYDPILSPPSAVVNYPSEIPGDYLVSLSEISPNQTPIHQNDVIEDINYSHSINKPVTGGLYEVTIASPFGLSCCFKKDTFQLISCLQVELLVNNQDCLPTKYELFIPSQMDLDQLNGKLVNKEDGILFDQKMSELLEQRDKINSFSINLRDLYPGKYRFIVYGFEAFREEISFNVNPFLSGESEIAILENPNKIGEFNIVSLRVDSIQSAHWMDLEGNVIETGKTANLTDGKYRVDILADDCMIFKEIEVRSGEVVQRSPMQSRRGIDLQFMNPVPSWTFFTVSITNDNKELWTRLEVVDMNGKIVDDMKWDFGGLVRKDIRVNYPGIYFIRASNASGSSIVKKLLITE